MALTYFKAVCAAVLEQPPTKPEFVKGTPWADRLISLRVYRAQQERWRRIGKALGDQHVAYREIRNTPSSMRGMHGAGTLRSPINADGMLGRITDSSIVHTRPNHAARRRAGELGMARQDEIERQHEMIAAARVAIANGTWGKS